MLSNFSRTGYHRHRAARRNTKPPATKDWIAQHDAKKGETVKVVGFNANGSVDLSHNVCVAAKDIKKLSKVSIVDGYAYPLS